MDIVAEKNIVFDSSNLTFDRSEPHLLLTNVDTGLDRIDEIVLTKIRLPSYILNYSPVIIALGTSDANKQDYRSTVGYVKIHSFLLPRNLPERIISRYNLRIHYQSNKTSRQVDDDLDRFTDRLTHNFVYDSTSTTKHNFVENDSIVTGMYINIIPVRNDVYDAGSTQEANQKQSLYLNSRDGTNGIEYYFSFGKFENLSGDPPPTYNNVHFFHENEVVACFVPGIDQIRTNRTSYPLP